MDWLRLYRELRSQRLRVLAEQGGAAALLARALEELGDAAVARAVERCAKGGELDTWCLERRLAAEAAVGVAARVLAEKLCGCASRCCSARLIAVARAVEKALGVEPRLAREAAARATARLGLRVEGRGKGRRVIACKEELARLCGKT